MNMRFVITKGDIVARIVIIAHTDMSVQATKKKKRMRMKIKLSNKLYITDAPKWLYKWCYNNLVLPNPDFYKKERLGKWTGNITEEKMDGAWRMEGNTMHVINEWIDVTLCFTEDGTLVMQRNDAEEGEPEDMVNTVLTRKS